MNNQQRWVAVVYDYGDKVGSHTFKGEESEARLEATEWVTVTYGEGWDWSFHRVSEN